MVRYGTTLRLLWIQVNAGLFNLVLMENNKDHLNEIIDLNPGEFNKPLLVFSDFFGDDKLTGHLNRLQTWRNCVLEDRYFKGDNGSPAELLYFYKLNLKLLEAACLLKDKMAEDELLNSRLVLAQVFDDYRLSQYREMLYEWLEYGLSVRAANEAIETVDLIRVYENLQKLYNAVWLIYQHFGNKPILKNNASFIIPAKEVLNTDPGVNLYTLNTNISEEQQDTLVRIVDMIIKKVSSVQAIIYLGTTPAKPGNTFLLVLTGEEEQRKAECLTSTIEESCRTISVVTALVHRSLTSIRASGDNLFFNNALRCPLVYLSGELILPVIKPVSDSITSKVLLNWQRWTGQGRDFLKGAEFYLSIGSDKAALYSLQQCAECLLIAIIRAVTGYGINIHNLERLLNLTRMFTNDIAEVFTLENDDNRKLFYVLKHAYINVRYKETVELEGGCTTKLLPMVVRLSAVIDQVYQKYLLMNSL